MSDEYQILISWPRLAYRMIRHLCGPNRAMEHELVARYRKARGYHLSREVRAERLRRSIEKWGDE